MQDDVIMAAGRVARLVHTSLPRSKHWTMLELSSTQRMRRKRHATFMNLVYCLLPTVVTSFLAGSNPPALQNRYDSLITGPSPASSLAYQAREIFRPLHVATKDTAEGQLLESSKESIWEKLGSLLIKVDYDALGNPTDTTSFKQYVQVVSTLRVGIPSLITATIAKMVYPSLSMVIAGLINDQGVFDVVANDYSQYIQNILTTSGLVFSLLIGQTYYFMYQQQEAIYLALFEEVTMAKSLLEQVALVSQGRDALYRRILSCMDLYIRNDLVRFNEVDPAIMLSARPVDDPLEDILYLTSVGEPSIVYQTVRSLRMARARRLGALQRKLPPIHRTLLWVLACIELCSFPLLGAGSQTIGGPELLQIQAWYLSFIVFGIVMVMGVIGELQMPSEVGAYNARTVLMLMVGGLEEELRERLDGSLTTSSFAPSVDGFVPVENYKEL